ncbi:hypothetical protein [Pedobacter sp. N23S346]|uniref:hypothetical protein n=1 Tax=Pedobacter sp. N23S346 TaxID=3402750 RepID=UPI003ABF7BBD
MSIFLQTFLSKRIFIVFLILLLCKISSAQDNHSKWKIKPSVGLNQAKFDWSIAGNSSGTNPNILSELIWQELKGPAFGLDIQYNITNRLRIKTINQYTSITKGAAEDTDYAEDNRQNAFYFDRFNAGKGYLFGTYLQLSYEALTIDLVSINPIIGFSYGQHQFHLLETGSNAMTTGLNSTYQTRYKGFDLGFESALELKAFNITAGILGGFYSYLAKANWNLIPDFAKPVSFTQKANAFALKGYANLSVPLNKSLELTLDYQINTINTHAGVDKAYFINQPVEETQFNGASFSGNTIALGINIIF